MTPWIQKRSDSGFDLQTVAPETTIPVGAISSGGSKTGCVSFLALYGVDEVRLLHAWRQYPEGPGSLFDFRDRHFALSYSAPLPPPVLVSEQHRLASADYTGQIESGAICGPRWLIS
jgi:hypothetical protein